MISSYLYCQKTDTIDDNQEYKSYIDTSLKYVEYFIKDDISQLYNRNLFLLTEPIKYLKFEKDTITKIINIFGFPNERNVLITKSVNFLLNNKPQGDIVVRFIFPKADRNSKNDSISISFQFNGEGIPLETNGHKPIGIEIFDYINTLKKFDEEMKKEMDSIK
jgi:hypothetical protein